LNFLRASLVTFRQCALLTDKRADDSELGDKNQLASGTTHIGLIAGFTYQKRPAMRSWPRGSSRLLLGVGALLVFVSPAWAGSPGGIGVLGDSYSDEYQFYPPDRPTARNWVEILARARGLNFGPFTTASRAEPRNQGFAFNWARSDAETEDLIRTGQHTGLAEQVARGEVSVAIVFIGGNDFVHALASEHPDKILDQVLRRAIANLDLAVETILKANPRVQVFVATLPNIVELPEFAVPVRSGRLSSSLAASYSQAVGRYNQHIRLMTVMKRRVSLVDLALATQLAPRPDPDHVIVAGRKLDRIHPANAGMHAFLADSRHISTLVQGMLANHVINALNARLDLRLKPLTLREVLEQIPGISPIAAREAR